ncbi:hypothetical protein G7072_13050 [Nocardioides sp. HDW12B]|uniref:hypothetical protein n=1 Tax=Nocardioides sp. HDW12B TaxID=2714939 RepID=UPI00140D544D|nr:hypothetical protein [Nocardioides sp. HDW12B]QIK67146.1 hypothetical protein G7072_13050 [Nocardioides sp. HDW12B]
MTRPDPAEGAAATAVGGSGPPRGGGAGGGRVALVLMGWLSLVLLADHDGSLTLQRFLGLATWGVLLLALRRVDATVRAQTAVVVVVATVVEYVFSPGLEVYTYRFDNVPAYVPPGHGLVYLSAYALGHAPWVRRHLDRATWLVVVGLGTWAALALRGDRPDVLGAFWFLCLLGFLRWGPSREVYVGAAVVVTWLEVLGTELATWTWQPTDPTGLVSIGNPPTGAAGGYGWFDLAGLLLAPTVLAAWARLRGDRPGAAAPPETAAVTSEAGPDPVPSGPADAGR